jgi:hypothetical protein
MLIRLYQIYLFKQASFIKDKIYLVLKYIIPLDNYFFIYETPNIFTNDQSDKKNPRGSITKTIGQSSYNNSSRPDFGQGIFFLIKLFFISITKRNY